MLPVFEGMFDNLFFDTRERNPKVIAMDFGEDILKDRDELTNV